MYLLGCEVGPLTILAFLEILFSLFPLKQVELSLK